MTKLYEITSQYQQMLDNALFLKDMTDQELTLLHGEEKETTLDIELALNTLKDSFESKAINVAKYIKNIEAESEAVKGAMRAMSERVKRLDNQAKSLTDYLKYNIKKVGLAERIKCPEFEIYIKTNPPKLIVDNESLTPSTYIKTKTVTEIDSAKIKKDLLEGFNVEGYHIERAEKLVIK
jgi:hypothetical protein